jgi:hypothetical protein
MKIPLMTWITEEPQRERPNDATCQDVWRRLESFITTEHRTQLFRTVHYDKQVERKNVRKQRVKEERKDRNKGRNKKE